MERILDIIFSGLALLLLAPLFLPLALILRLTGEGEIFYLQDRIGKERRLFRLYKFATMLKDSPNVGTGTITVKEDPRVLPVGRFLRKTKINELPQLINVLVGDMSVVGPRPMTSQTFNAYLPHIQQKISEVRPGLSGIGSIIFRSEEEIMHDLTAPIDFYNGVIAPYKGALEEWFVSRKSLRLYFLSIFTTIWCVLAPDTRAAWNIFRDLPEPPRELKQALNYPF